MGLLALKGHLACSEDENKDSHRPHIALNVILLGLPKHLRRHIAQRPASHLEQVVPRHLPVGETEVNQSQRLDRILERQEHILQLYVCMDHILPVHVLQGSQQLTGNAEHRRLMHR